MWQEFSEVKFVLHHTHDQFKVKHGKNVEAKVYTKEKVVETIQKDKDGFPIMNVSNA